MTEPRRPMRALTDNGPMIIPSPTAEQASFLGAHWNAVKWYEYTGDSLPLVMLAVTYTNHPELQGLHLTFNPDMIDFWSYLNEVEFESIYGDVDR